MMFSDKTRAELDRLIRKDFERQKVPSNPERLIQELEVLMPSFRAYVEAEKRGVTHWHELTGDGRTWLGQVQKKADALNEVLRNLPDDAKSFAKGILRLELAKGGHTPPPPGFDDDLPPGAIVAFAEAESAKHANGDDRPTEFLAALEYDLAVLDEVVVEIRSPKGTPGPRKWIDRELIARQVAKTLSQHGIRLTKTKDGTFVRVWHIVLKEAGASVPENPEDLSKLANEIIDELKEKRQAAVPEKAFKS